MNDPPQAGAGLARIIHEGVTKLTSRRNPLLEQEGWLRIKKYREASFESADGVVRHGRRDKNGFDTGYPRLTTPSAPSKERGLFFDGAATPPVPGGDYACL